MIVHAKCVLISKITENHSQKISDFLLCFFNLTQADAILHSVSRCKTKEKTKFSTTFASRRMKKISEANKDKLQIFIIQNISCDEDANKNKNVISHLPLLLTVSQKIQSVHKCHFKIKQVFNNNSQS